MKVPKSKPVAETKKELSAEARKTTRMLRGRTVQKVWRHRADEIGIQFEDGTRLFVDVRPRGLDLSITCLPEEA